MDDQRARRGRLGMLVGNGPYFTYSAEQLRGEPEVIIPLVKEGTEVKGVAIDKPCPDLNIDEIIARLKAANVEEVISTGDLGMCRDNGPFGQGVPIPDWAKPKVPPKDGENPDISLVSILQHFKGELAKAGIQAVSAKNRIPELRPPNGRLIPEGGGMVPDDLVTHLVQKVTRMVVTEPHAHVRHAVLFDNERVNRSAIESVDAVFNGIDGEFKPGGVIRTLVRVCPPELEEPTLDAPSVGIDTLGRCEEAGVDLIILDQHKALLRDPPDIADDAKDKGIAIVGVDVAAELRKRPV